MTVDSKIRKQIEFFRASSCVNTKLLQKWTYDDNKFTMPYPEVTGYTVPTVIKAGKLLFDDSILQFARDMLEGLLKFQSPNGGFGIRGEEYVFDTLAVMEGMLAGYKEFKDPRYLECAKKGGDFVVSMQDECGGYYNYCKNGVRTNDPCVWNGCMDFPGINIRMINIMKELGGKHNDSATRYIKWVCQDIIVAQENNNVYGSHRGNKTSYSHPMGYFIEGLCNLQLYDTAKKIVDKNIMPHIEDNGFMPFIVDIAGNKSNYAYVSGCCQYALVLSIMYREFKEGKYKACAEKLLSYYELCESKSGSPYGGSSQWCIKDGSMADTFPIQCNIWASKFYIDALSSLYPRWNWHKTSQMYKDEINNLVGDLKGKKIIEIGSATGHISLALSHDGAEVTLLDMKPSCIDTATRLWAQYNTKFDGVVSNVIIDVQKENYWDFAFNSGVIQAITQEQRIAMLKKTHTMMKSGAMYVAFGPCTDHPAFRVSEYKNESCVSDLRPDLELAGFKNIGQKTISQDRITEPYDFFMVWGTK